jgi:acyl-coenzyme A thioesterase PaaI-like protein
LSAREAIRRRVLRGIALNRIPGLHFPGNFLDISFDRVARERSSLSLVPGPWCTRANGEVDLAALALLADFGLAACIRANLRPESRLATVSFHLQFTGAPARGRLRADGEFRGFLRKGAGRVGMSRVSVSGRGGLVCFGTGTFMALAPPKGVNLHPVQTRREPVKLAERDLSPQETKILERADEALAARGNFIEHFWGPSGGVFRNGLHAGNRVGHAQGGIQFAMAAATAASALPAGWLPSSITAAYLSPGEGRVLHAKSSILHQGGTTAVVRTQITGKGNRRVLEVFSTHCRPSSK